MNKVLVTGGGGFIGLALVRTLCSRKIQVRVLGRNHYPKAESAGARCIRGDIRDAATVARAVQGCDTVFHVAAKAGIWGTYRQYHSINVIGTQNVIEACHNHGVQVLVYTSTPSVVFDGRDLQGVDESIPYASAPLCHYTTTKIQAEKLVLETNDQRLRTAAIRPHLVWGPGDTNLIPRLMQRGRERSLRIVGNGNNLVDIAYIDNVVHAHILAAHNLHTRATAAARPFFIGQQQAVALWPWINDLFARMQIPVVTKKISLAQARILGRLLETVHTLLRLQSEPKMTRFLAEQLAMSHWFSKKNAETILGYREQVSTDQGMERLVSWLQTTDQHHPNPEG